MAKLDLDMETLWVMLLSTIRYSIGRYTYMPSVCLEYIKEHGKHLEKFQLLQIESEILRELEREESIPYRGIWHDVANKCAYLAKGKL